MNYEEMSDFEINKCVAEAAGMELSSDHSGAYVGVVRRSIGSRPNYGHVNYCNNPFDAWPIIVERGISLLDPEMCGATPDWCAMKFIPSYGARNVEVYNKNPLRAAMVVFLMMQEQYK